ncbi:MAG: hypothetical protein A2161_20525 [Candidatus Schekmanbacteria bacterium RBG_13_48_7]|uniref:Rhodanese domain-containing protein n=1 Tax=Candidatus Schekmanbacteria bacterium RBG_13_48_7 TaxID=1817878 RepID=A0A1F7RNH2_9BACT|nr:MAG: hypothetical protein A2161_20525 [Candidatus Schekmanbacteria bacterium RBG_13_48_7]
MIAVIMLASIFGLTLNELRGAGGIPLYSPDKNNTLVDMVEEIYLDQAIEAFEQGTPLFIDARPVEEYYAGHIDGAINIPYLKIKQNPGLYKFDIPIDRSLIIYCGSTECDVSKSLAIILIKKGYKDVTVFSGGWTEWFEHGFPMVQGGSDDSPAESPGIKVIFEIPGIVFLLIFLTIYTVFPKFPIIAGLRRFLTHPFCLLVLRVIMGSLFVYASIDKIINPKAFFEIVTNYHSLPHAAIPIFSVILPWIECLAGSFLILGIFSKNNSLVLVLLLSLFAIAIFAANLRGINTACGCFTTSNGGKADWGLILRDLLLIFAGIQILLGRYSYLALENVVGFLNFNTTISDRKNSNSVSDSDN